jgi:hypothetical protein
MTRAIGVNDNVDFVLALPLAHLRVHLQVDRAGGGRLSPGMAQKSTDEARRRAGGRTIR